MNKQEALEILESQRNFYLDNRAVILGAALNWGVKSIKTVQAREWQPIATVQPKIGDKALLLIDGNTPDAWVISASFVRLSNVSPTYFDKSKKRISSSLCVSRLVCSEW